MSKHWKWVKLAVIGLACVSTANADHAPGHTGGMKGLVIGGSFEGGLGHTWNAAAKNTGFLVDHAALNITAEVSDKTKVIFNNAFAMGTAIATMPNTAGYFSPVATLGNTAGTFAFGNTAAYVEHKCSDGFTTAVGHFLNPFGMEGLHSRYDMPTYYYSTAYSAAHAAGWRYDLGVKFTLSDIFPGAAEIAIVEGNQVDNLSPGAVIRWWYEMKSGDWSFTPVVSTYLGRWHGGPRDLGLTAGGMFKMGTLWANAEWVYVDRKPQAGGASTAKGWSAYLEPGMDLGMANVSLKAEYVNNNVTNDINLGVAVGHTYSEKYRIRATYQHTGLGGKIAAHTNDFRLLFGTMW